MHGLKGTKSKAENCSAPRKHCLPRLAFLSYTEVSVHQIDPTMLSTWNLCHILHLHFGSPSRLLATINMRLQLQCETLLGLPRESTKKGRNKKFGECITTISYNVIHMYGFLKIKCLINVLVLSAWPILSHCRRWCSISISTLPIRSNNQYCDSNGNLHMQTHIQTHYRISRCASAPEAQHWTVETHAHSGFNNHAHHPQYQHVPIYTYIA